MLRNVLGLNKNIQQFISYNVLHRHKTKIIFTIHNITCIYLCFNEQYKYLNIFIYIDIEINK